MNIVQINATANIGSTGKIMCDLDSVINVNHNGFMICAYQGNYCVDNLYTFNPQKDTLALKENILISRITGIMGHRHSDATKKAIKWIKEKNPDIIHLHNIHGDWIDYRILFKYIKEYQIPVVWTLHDCWSFTGRCSHFELCKCEKWIDGCYSCKNKRVYPISYFFDHSLKLWKEKKEIFTSLSKMIIVTPSEWLKMYVERSFLSIYPTFVINNGIDINIYKPILTKSHYYSKLNERKIILGVASSWSKEKGLEDFLKLNALIDHQSYQIVLVGLNSGQKRSIPSDIIGISRTNNRDELVELYSGANVFVNLTYQDNYPTTNLEAIACGTPVITYDTGGSPESLPSKKYVVEKGNIKQVYRYIIEICSKPKNSTELRSYALAKFDKNDKYNEYLKLYNKLNH